MAQVTCRSEVSYQWKKPQEEELIKVSLALVQADGPDETSAKARLEKLTLAELAKAREACRAQHENLSGCLASKTAASAGVLQSLAFASRKALEDAIGSDCKALTGTCKEAVASEPVCSAETSGAGGSGEAGAASRTEGKEAKGGKKK